MKKRFCVIADKCQGNHAFARTWKETKSEAEQHAQALVRSRVSKGERPQPLLVVEVVSVVGPRPMEVDVTPAAEFPDMFAVDAGE